MESIYENAKRYIDRFARPLDRALWEYEFENGNKEKVFAELVKFQNPDGGFARGIEQDNRNPESNPMGVWKATKYLDWLGGLDPAHPIVAGMLDFLGKTPYFSENRWWNTIPSNDRAEGGVWWRYNPDGNRTSENPTASLAGFILKYADPETEAYRRAIGAARLLIPEFFRKRKRDPYGLNCYCEFFRYVPDFVGLADPAAFRKRANRFARAAIEGNSKKWGENDPCRPSSLIDSPDSFLLPGNERLVKKELDYLVKNQREDGAWDITYDWCAYPEVWRAVKSEARGEACVRYCRFYRSFTGR